MKSFFKTMFASMLGTILVFAVVFIFFIITIGAIVALSEPQPKAVKPNSILHLQLDKSIEERETNDILSNFSWSGSTSTIGLDKLCKMIDKAANDANIKGIYLDLNSVNASFATLEEIREKLIEFKKSGKFIISYADIYGQGAYYLATVSDQIYLNPQGEIDFRGLASEMYFLKNLFEKIGVEMQIIRHGKFKSAVEPFILDKMSEANREQVKTYIGSIWNNTVEKIAAARNVSGFELQTIADSLSARFPQKALAAHLVDSLKYRDEVINILKTKINAAPDASLSLVSYFDYKNSPATSKAAETKDKIAVVYAVGSIVKGKGSADEIGDISLAKAIAEARNNTDVKAVVLRINSPGGDALASENILREIALTRAQKPVIASFGDVAASGGYYIACKADKIIAQPNTITGSIGVFGMIPNAQKLLRDKIGIYFDTVKTNANSDFISVTRPMSDYQKWVMQQDIEKIYDVFISHVSQGRKMEKQKVDSIGQGRVWSGIDALKIGLVDELGGMDKAIAEAKKAAKIETCEIISLPREKSTMEVLMENFGENAKMKYLKQEVGAENYKILQELQRISNTEGIQARMPMSIRIY